MLEQTLSPAYLAYQEGKAVLEMLARVHEPAPPEETAAAPPLPKVDLSVRADVQIPHWSEQTLSSLVESLPDALVVIGGHGAIVLVNEQTERIFGYRKDQLLRRPIEVLIPERFQGGHVAFRTSYFDHPKVRPMGARLELFGRRSDGTEFPVEISLSPLKTEHGVCATAVIRDVSQHKREEAKFRTLVENIPAVTFFAPLDESVPELYVSPQIEKLLGFSQKEWLEDPVLWHRQLHPEDRETWNRKFAPTCATGKPFEETYRFIAKNGDVVWVHGSASVVRDADGTPSFLQGVAFDITKIKEAEEALHQTKEMLRQTNEELEQRVEERTAELEQFAYVASHDLTQPGRTIEYYLEEMQKAYGGSGDANADHLIDKSLGGVKRLKQLIKLLLSYSRVIRRDRVFKPSRTEQAALDACNNLQAAITESGAEVSLGEGFPTVLGNHEELVLLFQNLISNAVKFRDPERPIRVEVGVEAHADGWLFWVRDNGIGIEPQFLPGGPSGHKLFSIGVEGRVAPSGFAGNGYGLHICKKIVNGHGGKIWLKSAFGEGTTFFFTLPGTPLAA